jgi:hypothetical protein
MAQPNLNQVSASTQSVANPFAVDLIDKDNLETLIQEQQEPIRYEDIEEPDPLYVNLHELYRSKCPMYHKPKEDLLGLGWVLL